MVGICHLFYSVDSFLKIDGCHFAGYAFHFFLLYTILTDGLHLIQALDLIIYSVWIQPQAFTTFLFHSQGDH